MKETKGGDVGIIRGREKRKKGKRERERGRVGEKENAIFVYNSFTK